MPGGRSGGHFSGGRSFGGGHFGGSRSSHSSGGHFSNRSSTRTRNTSGGHFGGFRVGRSSSMTHGTSMWHRPTFHWRSHTTVVFGRPVYFGAGRAKTTSILSLLIIVAIIATIITGFGWYSSSQDVALIRSDYEYYRELAEYAQNHASYQIDGDVYLIKQYKDSNKYCIFYTFGNGGKGYSFYVYDYNAAADLDENGVRLALDSRSTVAGSSTESVPLDYMYTSLEDDAEYVDYVKTSAMWKISVCIAGGILGLLIVASVIVSMTAKKATPEQIEESEKAKNTEGNAESEDTSNKSEPWKCGYCGSLNDATKHTCDSCGAGRQK